MPKILLVDDSEPNRAMLSRRLERKGYQVVQAVDGQQAVDMARDEAPDVVLMDLNLPVLDGWTATRRIKACTGTSHVPVIALTAHAMSGDRQRALQAGCDDYDTKPVDLARLIRKIEAVCTAAQAPPVAAPQPPRVPPIHAAAPAPPLGTAADATAPGAGRVLVVDDTEANRELAARWLRRKGFVVDTANDGPQALARVEAAAYDAVLLDVMMPGIDGLEVLRRLRLSRPATELPVIMATAKDASQDVVQALALGANDYVTKPLDLPVLLARVTTQVSVRRSVEQIRALERGLEHRNRQLHSANARMQEDLRAAARVQEALLPTVGPRVDGYRFAWGFEPSATLAGDILNVFGLDDDRVGAYVLDVSGHGVAAALLSVTVSRFLSPTPDPSSMLWRRRDERETAADAPYATADFAVEPPANVAARLSRRFPFDQRTWQYFTMVYGLLDTRRHTFTYVSAGHPPILRVAASGEAGPIDATGFPIGVGQDGAYDEYTIALAPGDRLYIHSDGMTEAMSPARELFGVGRVLDVLRAARARPLEASLADLSAAVRAWAGTTARDDDETVLAIERLPTS